MQNYVKSTGGKLELYFLPGYAPELNPDELVWNYAAVGSVGALAASSLGKAMAKMEISPLINRPAWRPA